MSKYYTVEYQTTNKTKEREFNDLSKANEFAEEQARDYGYDVRIYDNTRQNRKIIAEDWGKRWVKKSMKRWDILNKKKFIISKWD